MNVYYIHAAPEKMNVITPVRVVFLYHEYIICHVISTPVPVNALTCAHAHRHTYKMFVSFLSLSLSLAVFTPFL